ncbi:polycystin family receptor for egg jelly [Molossus nigricans]
MRPAPALLLLLGLGWGCGHRPPPQAPRGAPAVSALVPGAPAAAHDSKAGPRVPAQGEVTTPRSVGGAQGLGLPGGHTHLGLRPRRALRGGLLSDGSLRLCCFRGPARWPRWRRAPRSAPAHADSHLSAPGGQLSRQGLAHLRRSLGPGSPRDAPSASSGLPRSTPPGGPHPSAGFVTPTQCPTDALRPVVSEAVNSGGSPAPDSSVSCPLLRQGTCVIKKLKVNSYIGRPPLLLTRDKNISLYATLSYDCPSLQSKHTDWSVFSTPSLIKEPDWTKPLVIPTLQVGNDPTIVHVLKNTLFLGVYVFRFSVSLVTASGLVVEGSDHAYVSIVSNFLRAVILGDADIKINFTDGLVLNGSTSSDPDVDNPLEGLLFSWYCTTNPKNYNRNKINVISKDVCLPEQGDLEWTWASGPVLTVLPETLKGDQVYFFRMVIKKHHRTAFAAKRVQVLQGPTPAAHISCIENCDAVLVISDRFSLCLICTNCLTSRDVYKWSILLPSGGEIGFDWTGQTSTGRNSSYLSIKAFAFKNFFEAKFWVSLDLAAWSGVTTVLKYPFIINYAPEIGECNINPTNGTAFFTKFIVHCSNFKDQNVPLTYKIIVSDLYGFAEISSLKENTLGPILYMGNKPTSPPSFLPVSMLDRQLATKIFVQVYDSLGAFSQVTLHAMVQAPTDRDSPESVLQRLLNFTTGQSSEMATLLQKQEFLPAGYLTYVAASVLNSVKAEPGLQEDRARLQEHLVNQSVVLPMNSLEEVSQVVTAITKLTQDTSAFRPVSRKLVTGRIWQANQALQQHQQNDANSRSEQIEIVSTGILTSVSNILKMSTHHQIVDDPFYVIQSLAETILTSKVPGNETTVTTTSSFNMYIRKVERTVATNVLGDEKHSRNRFHPTLNTSRVPGLSADAQISMVFCEFADDPFPWLNDQESPGTDVVGFRVTGVQATGQVLEITPDVADVYLARKNLSSAAFKLTVGPDNEPDKVEVLRQTTGAFRFEVDSREVRELLVHVVTEVTVLFTVLVYAGSQIALAALVATFLVPQDIPPVAHQNGLFDAACPVKMARVLCLPPSLLRVIAQRGGSSECSIVMVLQAPHFVMQPSDQLVRIALFSVRCLDMYGIQRDWIEDTCVLGETTTWDRVHCVCKNARRARRQLDAIRLANIRLRIRYLTAKVIVPPNPVDLRLEVIKKVAQNPVTVSTVFFIMASYIVLAFWALHRDETDQFVWDHVIVLPDNDPYDDICYLITVFTGSRCGSGTRANVFVQLRGTSSSSDVHCLSHPNFKTLYRASIHTFLLTTKSDLGDIRSIRVWHNNEGRAPSWYLSRIKVENLFTRHIWLFMCREWLSVDTSLDRTFHVTDPNQPLQTGDFFLIDVTDKLGKNHMWFSVFASATTKGFTRLQRLSCCLAMLLSSLMCNIMFFNLNTEEEDSDQGSRYIRSMVIGLESVVITIPVQVMITFLFTYSQRRPQVTLEEVSPRKPPAVEAGRHWEERLEKWHAQEITKALSKEADSSPPVADTTDQTDRTEPKELTHWTEPTEPTEPTDQTDRTEPTDPRLPKSPVKKTSKASHRHRDPTDRTDQTEPTDRTDQTEPTDRTEPTDPGFPKSPVKKTSKASRRHRDPTDRTDQTEPTDRTDRTEPTDPRLLKSSVKKTSKASHQHRDPTDRTDRTEPTDPRLLKSSVKKTSKASHQHRDPTDRTDQTEPTDRTEPTDPRLLKSPVKKTSKASHQHRDPTDRADRTEPTDPRLLKSPVKKTSKASHQHRDPTDRTDQTEPTDRTEPTDPRLLKSPVKKTSKASHQHRDPTDRADQTEPTDPGFLKSPVKKTSRASRRHKKAKSKDSGTHRTDTDTDTDTDTNVNTNANTNTNANDKTENASPEGPSAEPPPPAGPPPFTEKPRITLPSWCVYLAWFLVFATSGVSSFFIVFYGLTYGYERSIEWLFASFCSFCQSIFLVQPSKIIILSSIRSNRPKYCKNLPWVSNYRYSEIRLQDLRLHPEEMRLRHRQVAHLRSTSMYQPLTRDEIRIFKRRKKVKRRAWLFLSYGLTHFVFLALLLSLSALLQHTDSFRYNQFIRGQFSVDLAAVTTLDDIYRWLDSVLPPLFHNDRTPTFLPDSSSKILGLPLMRQVRAKLSREVCLSASRVPPDSIEGEIHCHPKYGTDLEDTDNYSGSWKKVGKQVADKNTKGFTYKPPEKRWVYHSYGLLHTYGSGGYAFYFFPDQQRFNSTVRLKDLQSSGWLDEKTWAVILDLTTFNPDASLLCSVSVLFEVSQLGVVNTSISVHSFSLADLDRKTSAEVYLYAAVLVFFLAYAAHDVYIITQERASYVTSVHNVLNFALKCLFVVLTALFFRKYILATGITHLYASNPVDFIPFHAVSQVDHAMRVTLGFLLFLTILKTLGYFRFFYEVRLAQRAIWIALPGICHVALLVSLCLFVYVAFGHLVFGQHEWNYSNFIDATQTVFSYCVSAFRNTDFSNNRVLGILFLSSFVLLLICVLISLFKAVILPAYEDMRQPVYEEPSEEVEAIAYLCGKLRALLGVLCFRPKAPKEPVLFADMLYGKPEAHSRRYLGLKTRSINERKMVYLVV